MKVNLLEAHDRLQHFQKQDFNIAECCQDLINQRPFGSHPFYIFAHARTIGMDEKWKMFMTGQYATFAQVPEKKLIWQPRLFKPEAQSNSMLFKAYPGSDVIKIIWMIPAIELWDEFETGKITANEMILDSIRTFKTDKKSLEQPEDDDPSEEAANKIYEEISRDANYKKSRGSKLIIPDFRV